MNQSVNQSVSRLCLLPSGQTYSLLQRTLREENQTQVSGVFQKTSQDWIQVCWNSNIPHSQLYTLCSILYALCSCYYYHHDYDHRRRFVSQHRGNSCPGRLLRSGRVLPGPGGRRLQAWHGVREHVQARHKVRLYMEHCSCVGDGDDGNVMVIMVVMMW